VSLRFQIRAALASDLPAVVALERSIGEAPHWAEAEYTGILGADAGASVRRCLLVAERAEQLVGFAVGKVIGSGPDTMAELESVVVAEEARRAGIGRALLEGVLAWCREMGAAEVELEVRSENSAAIALYRRMAFVEVGLRRRYYQAPEDDAVLMRIEIRTADPG
jgi:[ribosomal protein S18]-alanine N-acetyltransferase